MTTQAVILCGGKGTRLNDHIRYNPAIETPKPLIEVGGKPFVTYAINMLRGVGFDDVVMLVGYMKDTYDFLNKELVRLVETQENFNNAVLAIPDLQDIFVLLNGDCFPVMDRADWFHLRVSTDPLVLVKIVDRDAGLALVRKSDVYTGKVDCSKIGDMRGVYREYIIQGGLHIGTPQGLQRARQYMDIVVFGQ